MFNHVRDHIKCKPSLCLSSLSKSFTLLNTTRHCYCKQQHIEPQGLVRSYKTPFASFNVGSIFQRLPCAAQFLLEKRTFFLTNFCLVFFSFTALFYANDISMKQTKGYLAVASASLHTNIKPLQICCESFYFFHLFLLICTKNMFSTLDVRQTCGS